MNATRFINRKLLQNTALSAFRTTIYIRSASQTTAKDDTTQKDDTTHFGFQTVRAEEKQQKGI